MKPEVAVFDSEDINEFENSVDWQFVSLDKQDFGIRTAGLEMLGCFCELNEGFAPYAEEVIKRIVPLKLYFHDGVRPQCRRRVTPLPPRVC